MRVLDEATVRRRYLSSEQETVSPLCNFIYPLPRSKLFPYTTLFRSLRATVPKGASFISADSGGVLNAGTVTWSLGTLPVGGNVEQKADFQSHCSLISPLLPVEEIAADTAGHIARFSERRILYSAPLF